MARSSDPLTLTEDEIWGTWEELLLACAVNRHGAHSWDSVVVEVRSRSPYAHLLTSDNCRRQYRLLKRRFSGGGDGINGGDEFDEEEPTVEIPWLDELRKLRVAELRQEVQRYDVSIGSLQLKVKRLKEERERSLIEPEAGDGVNESGSGAGSGSDPKEKNDQQKNHTESPRSTPENTAGDRISGEDSGRSCKESNNTEPKVEEVKVNERVKEEADPAVNGSRSDPLSAAAASYNGSSDTIAKGAVKPNPVLNESGESVAESKGSEDEEGEKESSDVQSSASLSRRRRRGRRRRSASTSAVPEAEALSPVRKEVDVESQPLIAFLETIRSREDGSVFDRRLESQANVRYRSLVRRHVDLEMVRNRIGRIGYTSAEFFRDLLLLCNNALVFYPKNSPESISAVHLRDLINKEIASTLQKTPQPSPQSAKVPTPPPPPPPPPPPLPPAQQPLPAPSKPKSDPHQALEKPASLPPLLACLKRSSISAKRAKLGTKKVEKEEKTAEIEEEEEEEEKVTDKKSTKKRSSVSRGLRTSKARGAKNPNPKTVSDPKPEPAEQETAKSSAAAAAGGSTAKKRSAADFLNRIKSSSPSSSNGKDFETPKSLSSSRRGGGEQRKKSKEDSTAAAGKRNVGRPPKRAAAVVPTKRGREEKTPPVAKKRGRR